MSGLCPGLNASTIFHGFSLREAKEERIKIKKINDVVGDLCKLGNLSNSSPPSSSGAQIKFHLNFALLFSRADY